jgi:uncharacterized membrane protein YdfJ with MMPL/SSD domain
MIRKISGFSARRPIVVLVLWIAMLGAGFGIGIGVFDRLVPDNGKVPGSESQRVETRLERSAPEGARLRAVIAGRPVGDPALRGAVNHAIAQIRAMPGVAEVSQAQPSAQTGQAFLIEIRLRAGDGDEDAAQAVADLLHAVEAPQVAVAGGPLTDAEADGQAKKDVSRAEMLSMPIVLILLVIVFGGLLAAGLPLLIAVVGIGGTFGVLYTFSLFTDVSVYSIQITTMLAVGLGVDYALLIVNRFKEERRTAPDVPAAIAGATATAGRTVLFSGLTVAVALAGLVVFPDPFLRSMGFAGAAVVLVDMLAALTLLPALLALVGKRIAPAKRASGGAVFARVARGVQRRPLLTLLGTAAVLLVLAAPVAGLRISNGDPRMLPTSTEARQVWDALPVHFPDRAGPAAVEVLADAGASDPALGRLRTQIAALPGVAATEVEQLGPRLTLLRVQPQASAHEPAGRAVVTGIRELPAPFRVEVGNDAAQLADYRAMLAERLPWAIAVVTLGTLLLLFAFTGSMLLPIKAVLTNLLSIGAALGAVVWIFQQGNLVALVGGLELGYVHLTVPVLVGAIAFGLSMDYEVFLLSRIREQWLATGDAEGAVVEGLRRTGGIVTAAALVIAVVFAGFVFGGFAPIKAIGLGLVLAIALDATVVRMLLVPATMTLLGRANWWLPKPLRRVHGKVGLTESAEPPRQDVLV